MSIWTARAAPSFGRNSDQGNPVPTIRSVSQPCMSSQLGSVPRRPMAPVTKGRSSGSTSLPKRAFATPAPEKRGHLAYEPGWSRSTARSSAPIAPVMPWPDNRRCSKLPSVRAVRRRIARLHVQNQIGGIDAFVDQTLAARFEPEIGRDLAPWYSPPGSADLGTTKAARHRLRRSWRRSGGRRSTRAAATAVSFSRFSITTAEDLEVLLTVVVHAAPGGGPR